MLYVDTSALVAYYCPEPISAKTQKAMQSSRRLVITPLVEVELHSALAIKVRAKQLPRVDAEKVMSLFRRHLDEGVYTVVPIGTEQYIMARTWIATFAVALRTLDALHLAAASTHGLALLTADRELARAARRFGVECKLVS